MNRNAIHRQITTLAEKISHLNNMLLNEDILHPLEVELLRGYAKELQGMIEQLSSIKSDWETINKKEGAAAKPVSPVEEKETSQKAVKADAEEIKLHQHILDIVEKAVVSNTVTDIDSEIKNQEKEHFRNWPAEERVIRKTPVTAGATGDQKREVSLNEKFRKETTAISDKLKGAKKKSVKELFDLNERYKYIEDLFGGSSEQFNKALQDLGKMSNRGEAENYIRNIESKYSWEKKQVIAVRFSEKVLSFIG